MDAPLRFALGLADNTRPAAEALAAAIETRLGRPVRSVVWQDIVADGSAGDGPLVTWACGLETVRRLDAGELAADIVAAPVFEGAAAADYGSVLLGRRGASRGLHALIADGDAVLAINERASWSGHHALRVHLLDAGLGVQPFRAVVETGSHVASLRALLAGEADVAAIDETVWQHAAARDPGVRELRVLDRTQRWPAPPFAVSRVLDPDERAAIRDVLVTARPAGLARIEPADDAAYDPIRAGYARSLAAG